MNGLYVNYRIKLFKTSPGKLPPADPEGRPVEPMHTSGFQRSDPASRAGPSASSTPQGHTLVPRQQAILRKSPCLSGGPPRSSPSKPSFAQSCPTHRSRHWASLLPGTSSRILNQSCSPYLATACSNFCRKTEAEPVTTCLSQASPNSRPQSSVPQTYRVLLWGPEPLLQAGVQALGPAVDELHGVPPLHVVDNCRQRGLVGAELPGSPREEPH